MTSAKRLSNVEIPCFFLKIFFEKVSFPKGLYKPHGEYIHMRKFKGKEALRHGSQLGKFAASAGTAGHH